MHQRGEISATNAEGRRGSVMGRGRKQWRSRGSSSTRLREVTEELGGEQIEAKVEWGMRKKY